MHTQWSRMMVRTCTSVPNSSLSHSVSTRSKPRAPASASSTGSAAPSIHAGGSMPAMAQKVGARSTSPTGALTTDGGRRARGRRSPHQRQAHERIHVVGALEQQPEVPLQLAVVGGEHHVEVLAPPEAVDAGEDPPEGLVDELALDRVPGVDLAHLVGGEGGRHPVGRGLVVGHQGPVVPEPPVAGLGVEDGLALGPVLGIPVGQGHLAPVDAADLGLRRVPGVVGVGEAHPAEPVLGRVQARPARRWCGRPPSRCGRSRDRSGLTLTWGAPVSRPRPR